MNALMDTELSILAYGSISKIPSTVLAPPPHTHQILSHIDCFMDDVISVVQGRLECQHRVFDGTVHSLKWLFPSLPGDSKDLVIVKKLLAGEGEWTCIKEVLGWKIYT